jgi:hypothetical protein
MVNAAILSLTAIQAVIKRQNLQFSNNLYPASFQISAHEMAALVAELTNEEFNLVRQAGSNECALQK